MRRLEEEENSSSSLSNLTFPGYGGYGHDVDRGARLIELTQHSVKTWIRMEDGSSMYPMEVPYPKSVLENMALNQVY